MTSLATDASSGTSAGAVTDAYQDFCGGFARLLGAIADHDRSESYKVLGVRSEDDWLRRVFDLEWRTARDWTRQARLVAARPDIGEQLASGEMSVDKLRSMAEMVGVQNPDSVKPKGPFDDDDDGPAPDPYPSPQPEPDGCADPEPEPTLSLEELIARLAELSARQVAAKAAEARAEEARRRDRWRTRHLNVFRSDGEGRLAVRDGALFGDDATTVMAAFEDYASRAGINQRPGPGIHATLW
jgi:hypothetical protein